MADTRAHNGDVRALDTSGFERAECDCDWHGPKRTSVSGIAHEDLIRHFDEVDGHPNAHDLAAAIAQDGPVAKNDDQQACPHIKGTVKWGIAADKKWCDICKRFVQLTIDWSGHP